jgi:hypothetical protein
MTRAKNRLNGGIVAGETVSLAVGAVKNRTFVIDFGNKKDIC